MDIVRVDSAIIYINSWSIKDIIDRLHDSRFAAKSENDDKAESVDDTSPTPGVGRSRLLKMGEV